ncbi:Calmodulin like 42, putative [Theobroma cacao]|uniref:Calmodulin like 42, putative n=1 Tax=Theobroma cacao TaxID=3641 RepID=A0A061GJ66_THECC|nr:Calmodulin like 42, putative [Theobroma cacao]
MVFEQVQRVKQFESLSSHFPLQLKMIGITGACSRLMGELLHGLRRVRSTSAHNIDPIHPAAFKPQEEARRAPVDDSMLRALTAVFGMESNGRITKEKARQVVEKLGLVEGEGDATNFDLPGGGGAAAGGGGLEDEVAVEEVLGGFMEDGSKRNELLRQAFRIFDEDGNGFIDALELKRVLQCLGLDNGWDMGQIEKMLMVVDLNLDGKVDFREFELMMG